jgi:hypothetical protein
MYQKLSYRVQPKKWGKITSDGKHLSCKVPSIDRINFHLKQLGGCFMINSIVKEMGHCARTTVKPSKLPARTCERVKSYFAINLNDYSRN